MKQHVEFDIEFKENTYPGRFIAIEGMDRSGKTTQTNRIVDVLKKEGHKVIYTKEPTDGVIGKFIRDILSGKTKVTPVGLQYLFSADRAEHQEEIVNYLKQGFVVITDRYFWSSVAYGIADLEGEGNFYLTAYSILSFYNRFLKPDNTYYIKINPEIAMERVKKSGAADIYDNMEKLVKIEKGYNFLLEKFPNEFIFINGEKNVEEVTNEILDKIKPYLTKQA